MKKNVLALVAAVLTVAGTAPMAFSAQEDENVAVNLTVNGVFSITSNQGTINLPVANVGDESASPFGLSVNSNHGVEWTIRLGANPPLHTDGVTVIPPANFRYSLGGGAGVHAAGDGIAAQVPNPPATIYTSAPGEYSTNNLGFGAWVIVNVPLTQKNGNYTTTLNFSLLDAI